MAIDESKVEAIYFAALDKLSPEERLAYLDEACANDASLRLRVEALLNAQPKLGHFLQGHAAEMVTMTSAPLPSERPGTRIGPYKLLKQIGEGGMGTVFMAEQHEPVKRRVALKVIKVGMDTRQVIARFEAERQALTLMDHPNIAKVLDAGTTGSGRPYFVMELVKGQPITQYCDEHHLTPRQRLELLIPVCHAIQHAHQKGIIHRDIKPTNILVAEYDEQPVPKVIDFGVAKATSQALTEKTMFTGLGQIVGTLEYMSPEQAKVNQLDIDTRSDIYSLGVLLYELLTGSTPFDRQRLRSAAFDEMLRIIREEDPPKPSTRLSDSHNSLASISARRHTEPAKLTKLVRGDLDWIVMKCLEKDRNRRYETAVGFAADLERYLNDEPVHACPPSAWYLLRKFAQRNRTAVLTISAILFVLVAGIAGTTFGLIRAEDRRKEAELAQTREATQRQIAENQRKKAEQAEADTLADYRASTDDAIEQLIGAKPDLGPQERAYLERTLKRWQAFAARQSDDEHSPAIRAEGHFRVATLWQRLGRRDEARTELEIARNLQQQLVAAFPGVPEYQEQLAATHSNFGLLLTGLGQHSAARTEFETARDLQQNLVAAFPAVSRYRQELAGTHSGLGSLLYSLNQRDAARTEYETARDLQQKLAVAFPAVPQYQLDLAKTHHNLAVLLNRVGQRDEAHTQFEAARDLQKRLNAAFPGVPENQRNLARTQHNMAVLLDELDRRDEARTEFEAARDLRKTLAAQFPTVPDYQQDLALTHNALGLLLTSLLQPGPARSEYEAALDLQQKLAVSFPTVPEYQEDLAGTHNNFALLLTGLGQHGAARTHYETARDLHQKLAATFPAVPDYQVNLGASYCNFGILVRDEGQPADSLQWFELAIRTLTPIFEHDRRAATAKAFLRNSHVNRAKAYDLLKQHAEAVKDWDRTVELSPGSEQPAYRPGRAYSRLQAGHTDEAVAEVDELTTMPNWSADRWYDFACVYAVASTRVAHKRQEYADRSMELVRKAVQSGYKDARHLAKDTDLDALRGRDDFQKVLAELERATK